MNDGNCFRIMRPLRIYLGDLTYTTLSLATDAFPLNIGFIAAYTQKIFGNQIDLKLFKYVGDLENAINENPPDILGLSNYPWNFNLGLEFFRMIRELSPRTIRVMGGPNIPQEDEDRMHFISAILSSTFMPTWRAKKHSPPWWLAPSTPVLTARR